LGTKRKRGREGRGTSNPSRGLRSRAGRYPKLKPGPGCPAVEVVAHQRSRLRAAMVELVAERGYEGVTVALLAERARVSTRDFYKRFAGKEECFIATYDDVVERSLRGILAVIDGEDEPGERLRLGLLAYTAQIADDPETARLAMVEVFAAGAGAVARMLRANGLFEALLARSFAAGNPGMTLPPLVVKGIVSGISRLARARLLSGQPRRLTVDGAELVSWVLALCDEGAVRLQGLEAAAPTLPAVVVEAPPGDERGLILAATARLAGAGGYASLSVSGLRAAAGVSRRSFDNHFDGLTDCFLATVDTLTGRTLAAAAPAYLTADDWASGVHRMIAALCRHLAHDEALARLAFLEVFSPGAAAVGWRADRISRLARILRRGAGPGRQPTEFEAEASVGAIWGVVHAFVATGRAARLPMAAPTLSYLALAPALGGATAVDVTVAEGERDGRLGADRGSVVPS
jgi:AcrR family transcriptional regulator